MGTRRYDLQTFSLSRETQDTITRLAKEKRVYRSTIIELAVCTLADKFEKEVQNSAT